MMMECFGMTSIIMEIGVREVITNELSKYL